MYESTYYKWIRHYGKDYQHNGAIPRDHWLQAWEKRAIIDFYIDNPLNGYRRLTYMMLDADVVAVSPATVYRVLKAENMLGNKSTKSKTKGTGFDQPDRPHAHWHVDVAYLNICGTFYYMTTVIDGFSRAVIHWEIREQMKELDIETILQRAREKFPEQTTRVITDNGPQFVSGDFKQFVRISGMSHVRTSPYYPQSNGKIERYHRTIKNDCIREKTPLSLEEARRVVGEFVATYNEERLHSAIGYITPNDMLAGRQQEIHDGRDAKLQAARAQREESRKKARLRDDAKYTTDVQPEDRALLRSNLSAELNAKSEEETAAA